MTHMSTWDLFFIEHRMGAWRTGIIEESDIAFRTINLFNSRRILRNFYGVPEASRSTGNALKAILDRELPELKDIPFNPKVFS